MRGSLMKVVDVVVVVNSNAEWEVTETDTNDTSGESEKAQQLLICSSLELSPLLEISNTESCTSHDTPIGCH
jgi:hypothetical protein